MTTKTEEALVNILELARRVRTQQGAKLYGKPIGSLINDDTVVGGANAPQNAPANSPQFALPQNATPTGPAGVEDENKAPVKKITLERLKSLQRQLRQAMKTGDESQVKKLNREMSEAVTAYGKDRPAAQVMLDLGSLTTRK